MLKFSEMSTQHLTNAIAFHERRLNEWLSRLAGGCHDFDDYYALADIAEETVERESERLRAMRAELAKRCGIRSAAARRRADDP